MLCKVSDNALYNTEPDWRSSPERIVARRQILAVFTTAIAILIIGGVLFNTLWTPREPAAEDRARPTVERFTQTSADRDSALLIVRTLEQQLFQARSDGCKTDCVNLAAQLNAMQMEAALLDIRVALATAGNELAMSDIRSAIAADVHDKVFVSSVAAAILGLAIMLAALVNATGKSRLKERLALENLRALSEEASESGFDVIARLKMNERRLRTYHGLVTRYADDSRRLTIIALVAGLTFVAVCGIAATLSQSLSGAVGGSVAAASISAMTAFVVSAILRNSEASSQEVRAFFLHPIQQERALNAERLLSQLPERERSAALLSIISSLAALGAIPPAN